MTETTVAPPEVEPQAAEPPTSDRNPTETAAPAPEAALGFAPLPAPPGPANPSPDLAQIAFLQADATGTLRLWLQALDGGEARALDLSLEPLVELDPSGDPGGDDGPQWSPDGTTLAVTGGHPDDGLPAIWLVDVESGESRLLTQHPAADRGPRWSPDGRTIAFTSFRDGRDAIWTVDVAGGAASQWTDGLQDDRDPAWSRDGSQLAFRRAVAGHPTHHDLWCLTLATGELKQLTNIPGRANSKAANRRSHKWAPNRALIAFVTDEKEWDSIAVVNPENLSGWTLADEPGDKGEVRWSPNGLRILYTRTQGAITHCCAKGTSAAKPDLLDTQNGVARQPRWLGDSRALYLHATPATPWRFVVQDAKVDAERQELARAVAWTGPSEGLTAPEAWETEVGDGAKIGGLLYRPAGAAGAAPAVVALGDGPPHRQAALPSPLHQALAAAGFAVFAPNLRGTPGAGRAFTNQLAELVDREVEGADLAEIAGGLGALEEIDRDRIAIVGRGFGGTLALLAAASRPGHFTAVIAVDPIVDWTLELDAGDGPDRLWALRQFGLPATSGGRYAIRSPRTFAPLLKIPVLLASSAGASPVRLVQVDAFTALLAELGIGCERASIDEEAGGIGRLAVDFLSRLLSVAEPVAEIAAPAPVAEPPAADDVAAADPPAESAEAGVVAAQDRPDSG
jgi:Tol biopolymer transport system component/dienelactone hydrolase